MYTIGEFSKIGSVSTKTLRYYDEIGLLHPAYVDSITRYRYYSEEQVDQIIYIMELKTLALRLEQIKMIIENNDSSLLERFLKERIVELDCQIEENMQLQQSLKQKLHDLSLGGIKMNQQLDLVVEAKNFAPTTVISKQATIEISQIGEVIGSVFETIYQNGLQPTGPVMTFYLDDEFNNEQARVEVCVPINETTKIEGVKTIAPGLCATCLYQGVYSKLGKAYAAVLKWIETHDYKVSQAPFDIYLNSPHEVTNFDELKTQVYFPIMKK